MVDAQLEIGVLDISPHRSLSERLPKKGLPCLMGIGSERYLGQVPHVRALIPESQAIPKERGETDECIYQDVIQNTTN